MTEGSGIEAAHEPLHTGGTTVGTVQLPQQTVPMAGITELDYHTLRKGAGDTPAKTAAQFWAGISATGVVGVLGTFSAQQSLTLGQNWSTVCIVGSFCITFAAGLQACMKVWEAFFAPPDKAHSFCCQNIEAQFKSGQVRFAPAPPPPAPDPPPQSNAETAREELVRSLKQTNPLKK